MTSDKQLTSQELQARKEQAQRLGYEAFDRGIKCSCSHDARLTPVYAGASTRQHTLISEAWGRGWTQAYFAAQEQELRKLNAGELERRLLEAGRLGREAFEAHRTKDPFSDPRLEQLQDGAGLKDVTDLVGAWNDAWQREYWSDFERGLAAKKAAAVEAQQRGPRKPSGAEKKAFLEQFSSDFFGRERAEEIRAQPATPRTLENTGTCPVCFGNFKLRKLQGKDAMVLHGYSRSGSGFLEGQCFGVGHPPFELSAQGTVEFAEGPFESHLTGLLRALDDVLEGRVQRLTVGRREFQREVYPGDPSWESAFKQRVGLLRREIGKLARKGQHYLDIIASWRPRPLPFEGEAQDPTLPVAPE